MSTTLPRLDAITGAPLIGSWASSLLYMAELHQVLYYFSNFKQDNWKLKSYVAVAFTIDTISVVADYACVYLYTITHAGDLVYLTKQNWAVPLWFICCNCVAFFGSKLPRLPVLATNNTIIVCFLSILILATFGGAVFSGLMIVLFPAFKDRNKVLISGIFYIVTQVSADITIAGAYVREFMRAKSVFRGQRRINNMLNRLVLHTIQTGTATALIAVLALVVFLIDDETNISVGIMYSIGRVYVLSVLVNLNVRKSGRPKNSTISGQRGATHNTSAQLDDTSEPHRSNSGTRVKSSVLLPTLQFTASISETQPPEIHQVVRTDAQQVPEV
ncbi:hypothetical protein MSAN_00891600 [Mycena sanguinolenta]|uniref:DUF6534 domain-containing protein n=1 Tax=Mycena sanguinolenta TaxID=230812 RepID=A0A8H6YY10_9AGAR|nr:hypothetical protein MSAN_00891600 [Mycena sanguinolenta]